MKKGLLIIDVQNDYFPGGKLELHNANSALNTTQQLIKQFRKENLPIFYIQHLAANDAHFFVPNTVGVEIHPQIKPKMNDTVITKHYPNSFFKTNLEDKLKQHNITDLIICGMMSHMCIDTTVRYAHELGYNITIISDACTTKNLDWNGATYDAATVHHIFMAALNGRFANVTTRKRYFAHS